jgi:glycerophosphoryl diester phosphodiesterase
VAVLAAAVPAAQAAPLDHAVRHARAAEATGFDLQGHRGTRGLRPENTLAAFGKALQVGVTTLELDTGVTRDGVVVVSHERRISSLECQDTTPVTAGDPMFPYVGKLVHDLTLAQIKQLDCGTRHPANPATDPYIGTQEPVPGTRMPTLDQVFALTERYHADDVRFNIETKIDPTVVDTVDPETFTRKVIDVIRRHDAIERSTLQTFDWRTLTIARRLAPDLQRVALAQAATAQVGQPGPSPWLGGLDVDAFGGDIARAAKAIGADILSPNYGSGIVGTPGYVEYMSDAMIASAHHLGLPVVPWTVDDAATMDAIIGRGVDGIISDYPNVVRDVMRARHMHLPERIRSPFDVEAHRGGAGVMPQNTLASFGYGLSLKVDTLELDTGVTKDGVLVVAHDRKINPKHCADTAPAFPGDPLFPYAGKLIRDLTLAQIKTLDCGAVIDPEFAGATPVPGQRMPTLQQVFDLVRASGDRHVRFNIETKISPDVSDTVPYDVFTRKLVAIIEANHLERRAMIQSFDFRTIILAKKLDPTIETVALIWQFGLADCATKADECSLEARVGDPSLKSTWTAGLDWWQYLDLGRFVRAAGADVVSSNWQVHDPFQGTVASSDYYAKEDPSIFHGPDVAGLHRQGLRVVPYTVDREATMQRVIDLGVDGIITDFPARLIAVAKRNGLR